MTDLVMGNLVAVQLLQVTVAAGLIGFIAWKLMPSRPHLAHLLLLLLLVKCLTPPLIPSPLVIWPQSQGTAGRRRAGDVGRVHHQEWRNGAKPLHNNAACQRQL